MSGVWEQLFAERQWGKYPPEAVVRTFCRAFPEKEKRGSVDVLDVGCGPGANTWFLAREGFDVSGIDVSPTAIAQNRVRLSEESLTADLRIGDFTRALPWQAGSFDAVLDNVSLTHTAGPQHARAVAEVLRVLRPGGLFVSLSFTPRTWGYGTGLRGPTSSSWTDIPLGPLAGKGLVSFLDGVELGIAYQAFAPLTIDRASYTINGHHLVEVWVVTGRKPTDSP